MRRLGRRPFALCSALSLVLCVAVCVLWVASYFRFTLFYNGSERRLREPVTAVTSKGGVIVYTRVPLLTMAAMTSPTPRPRGALGFRFTNEPWNISNVAPIYGPPLPASYVPYLYVQIPYWPAALATAVLPAVWLHKASRRRSGRRRASEGLCPACGYDLRASPGRCPECGTVPEVTT